MNVSGRYVSIRQPHPEHSNFIKPPFVVHPPDRTKPTGSLEDRDCICQTTGTETHIRLRGRGLMRSLSPTTDGATGRKYYPTISYEVTKSRSEPARDYTTSQLSQ